MIKVLNATYEKIANLKNVVKCTKMESINDEFILDFDVILEDKVLAYITEDTVFEVDDNYFESSQVAWTLNADGSKYIKIQAEHISYRLNHEDYNMTYFAQTGTPAFVLGEILDGTDFTVGTVEGVPAVSYSILESKSRRLMLMEYAAVLEGELQFDKFEISIVAHRGSTDPKPVLKDRNVELISKTINKRELDADGNPKVVYDCTPIYLPADTYELGDDVILLQKELGLAEALRVVKMEHNPYDRSDVKMTFSNYMNGLENSVYKIITDSVVKDKLYNGCRIGPEFGFEVIRNDNLSRAFFRSDAFKIQKGDGTGGNWDDVFYIDVDGNIIMQGSIQILNVEGNSTIIDSYGIDPRYIDYAKNLVWNSSFEVSDGADKPHHWSGGISSPDSSLYGSNSLKLVVGAITRQSWAAGIEPDWVNRQVIRISMYANFVVDFKVRIVDIGTWVDSGGAIVQYYDLTPADTIPIPAYPNNLIPTMTSNTAPSGVALASSEFTAANAAWKSMDGSALTYWSSSIAGVTPCWIEYEFATPYTIERYTITARDDVSDGAPNTWILQGYSGLEWIDLTVESGVVFDIGEKKEFRFTNIIPYTKYRLYITANNGRATTNIAQVELMEEVLISPSWPELEYSGSNGWEDSRITFSFDSDQYAAATARFVIEVENVDTLGDLYIDGMMAHVDFTGKWAQLYKDGPRSISFASSGDAWTDTAPLSVDSGSQEFNKVVISTTAPNDKTSGWVDIS